MKKLVVLLSILAFTSSVYAEENNFLQSSSVNMTPKNSFSGYTNNGTRNIYPRLNTNEQRRQELLKPKSVHEIGSSPKSRTNMPMSLDSIPNNYDSSNMLHTPGLQNLQNVNMYF